MSPPFIPLSNLDVKFCLEMWFQEYQSNGYQYLLFKFVLVRLDDSIVPDSLKLEIDMKVCYSDDTLIKKYIDLPIVAVKEMDCYYFNDIIIDFKYVSNSTFTKNGRRLNNNEPFLVTCRMKFFDPLESNLIPANLPSPFLSSLKTSETSSSDIKSFKRSDEFSDIIIIRVESKLFFAHKSVLANHSSVFKQMMAQKLDNKTVLTIDDEMCDAFDNFMDYLYSGNFEDTSWPIVRDIYVLSAKYEVHTLKEKCATAILSHLSVDKICQILKVAYDYEDLNLKERATKFAFENIRDIISSNEWKELIASHPLAGYDVTVNFLH